MAKKIIKAHKELTALRDCIIVPSHVVRTETKEFRKSKKTLKTNGHFKCWICETEEKLEIHHFVAQWCLADSADFEKIKDFIENQWDPYGYGKLLKNIPITSIDDIRNMLVLCEQHHIGINKDNRRTGTGIHNTSFPTFIIQKVAKDGYNPVPQPGQNAEGMIKLTLMKDDNI